VNTVAAGVSFSGKLFDIKILGGIERFPLRNPDLGPLFRR
jgi:hypothetical protein